MDLKGEQIIKAPRDIVFAALNDPEIMKESIPGCQSLTKLSETEMEAEVGLKIGPVKATFKGAVQLSNINAPESYTITGEGKGGAAGHAKGGADVALREEGEHTLLAYDVKAQVGGKLAQLGSRLIDSTARKLSAQFFTRFGKIVESGQEDKAGGSPETPGLWSRLKSKVGAN